MKRYKELKYNKKTYTEQWRIDEELLKNGFQWFLDCEVEDVRLEISHNTLIFNSGTFFRGTWNYGVFRDGVWKYGTWENGVWYNGKWFNGVFKDGIIFDGKFFHGRMEKGEIKGGEFYHMEIDKSVKRVEEKPPKIEQEDNSIPQGEKITTEKMIKHIKSFKDFLNEDKYMNPKTKEEMWNRLIEIDDKLKEIDPDTDEATILSGEYDKISSELDAMDSMLEEQPELQPETEEELPEQGPEPEPIKPIRPEPTPQSRAEEWKKLSGNPGSRRIYRTMDDYLKHAHGDNYRPEEE